MVGRPVSQNGEVLDTDGDVVGHVSENYAQQQEKEDQEQQMPPLHELDGGLRVDEAGNIYNAKGEPIGKLNEPPAPKKSPSEDGKSQEKKPPCSCHDPDRAAPNPSEIYLDVKSTYDGIQLIIKIPTVFNRDLIPDPNKRWSAGTADTESSHTRHD